jgi:hypothetical protein
MERRPVAEKASRITDLHGRYDCYDHKQNEAMFGLVNENIPQLLIQQNRRETRGHPRSIRLIDQQFHADP